MFDVMLYLLLALLIYQVIVRLLSKFIRRRYQILDPSPFGRIFRSGFRRWIQPPEKVLERSQVEGSGTVMDLGCGSGFLTIPLAKMSGGRNLILAVDINEAFLKQLMEALSAEGLKDRVEIVQASAEELPFRSESIDFCVMSSVLQEIPNRFKALKEVRRVLKTGGKLAISEHVIDPDFPLRSTTIRLGVEAGLKPIRVEGSPWNYTVVFQKG